MDALAAGGAPFNRFHVTSLCSPTRASFFTGRNHHAVGMGFLADIPLGFPGLPRPARRRRPPPSPACCATPGTPRWPWASGTSRRAGSARPPGPSTPGRSASGSSATTGSSRATPTTGRRTWSATTTTSSRRAGPRTGYHLSEDLADQAVRMVQDQQQGAPGKPFFLYFALGAMHAPHHVAPEWVDPYRGAVRQGMGRLAGRAVRAPGGRPASCPRARCSRRDPNGCRPGATSRPTSDACSPASRRSSPAS